MKPRCGIIHSIEGGHPTDTHGCLLPIGHVGPHEFVAATGQRIQWETDLECQCEHCLEAQGDYCTTYWEVGP